MPYNSPEKKKAHNQKYYKDWYAKNGRIRSIDYREAIEEWKKNHPEAIKAHAKVYYAIRKGKIIKPDKCSECGRKTRLSSHHEDYKKPLNVLWLCSSCHKLKHT